MCKHMDLRDFNKGQNQSVCLFWPCVHCTLAYESQNWMMEQLKKMGYSESHVHNIMWMARGVCMCVLLSWGRDGTRIYYRKKPNFDVNHFDMYHLNTVSDKVQWHREFGGHNGMLLQ